MGGTGGEEPVEPEPRYLGSWEESCDHLEGEAEDACTDKPWKLVLGPAVLGGPPTFVSREGACQFPQVFGTFSYADGTLELFNCGSGTPQNAPEPEGLRFEVGVADDGESMVLVGEEREYRLRRVTVPPPSVLSKRLLWVENVGCDGDGSSMRYQAVDHDSQKAWSSTLAAQEGVLFMDEFHARSETTSNGLWTFYNADDRGAQAAVFPLEAGKRTTFYKVTYALDLSPAYAVGFEVDDCSNPGGGVRGFEYDFLRGATFRRFWNDTQYALDATSVIEVGGLEGTVNEVIVTVRTTGIPDDVDWTVSLTSPSGTTVTLVSGIVGDGSLRSFDFTTFADYATKSIADPELGSLADIFVPLNPLSAFQGDPKNGDWTLTISSGGAGGAVNYFGLSIR